MTSRSALTQAYSSLHRRRPEPPRRRTKLGMELLEERWTPAVFNVNTLADGFNLGPGRLSLRQAIQMANATPGGNTINLTVAGTYGLTLLGPGSGNDLTGALAILPSGGNLTIQNTSGGLAAVSGDGTDRVFDINPADTGTNAPFKVTLVGFAIENGVASPGDGAQGSGGGIRDQGNASLELDYVTVQDNTATADGGGIAMENVTNVPWKLTLDSSVIKDNHAGDAGGGIEEDGQGTVAINAGTYIQGNTTVNQGAGVWLDAIDGITANTTISGTVIRNNIAFTGVGGGVGNSGSGNVVFNTDLVENNYSGSAGGGFGDSGNTGDLTIEGSSDFQYNASAAGGGAIQEGGPLTIITDSSILNNTTQGNGGGVLAGNVNSPAQVVPNTVIGFYDVTIDGNTGVNGGGIEDTDTTLNISVSLVDNNKALGLNDATTISNGGGIDVPDTPMGMNVASTVNVIQTLFLGDFAGNNELGSGGGIYQGVGTLNVNSSEFFQNSAGNNGGGLDFSGTTLRLVGSTFFDNRAVLDGGGVEYDGKGLVSTNSYSYLINDTIAANTAGAAGGGVSARGTGDVFLVNDSITANYAMEGGGVSDQETGELLLKNTVVALDALINGGTLGPDVWSNSGFAVTDLGGNFLGTLSGSTGFGAGTLTGNPFLSPPATNGGPQVGTLAVHFGLLTEATLPGSPLINAGNPVGAPTTDARGVTRPTNVKPTIGAYQA
ncbi:MAG TPA: choice-of-anchor Q domain-containing protein [Isosphaeraceae bacterium]|nr:choice-of-anchor Q domain-containing protein [Isosphaeraceae bacterium]